MLILPVLLRLYCYFYHASSVRARASISTQARNHTLSLECTCSHRLSKATASISWLASSKNIIYTHSSFWWILPSWRVSSVTWGWKVTKTPRVIPCSLLLSKWWEWVSANGEGEKIHYVNGHRLMSCTLDIPVVQGCEYAGRGLSII